MLTLDGSPSSAKNGKIMAESISSFRFDSARISLPIFIVSSTLLGIVFPKGGSRHIVSGVGKILLRANSIHR
jgi:hypothetical protein